MNKGILNVIYQSDDNYAVVSAISIVSLLENNKHLKQINIFYLGHQLKKDSINKFNKMIGNYKNATITFVDVSSYPDELKEIGVKAWKGLYITWYKMLAFAKLDIKTDRILYINPHTVISGALDGLLELDFEDNVLALSYDATMVNAHKEVIGLKPTDGYFNCGIMLINHKKWMKDKIDAKMREHLRHNSYEVADQDLCNVFFKGKIKKIGVEYNFSTVFYALVMLLVAWFQACGKGVAAVVLTASVGVFFFITVFAGDTLFGFTGLTWAFPVTQMGSCALGVALFWASGRTRIRQREKA